MKTPKANHVNHFQTANDFDTQQASLAASRAGRESRHNVSNRPLIGGSDNVDKCDAATSGDVVRRHAAAARVEFAESGDKRSVCV